MTNTVNQTDICTPEQELPFLLQEPSNQHTDHHDQAQNKPKRKALKTEPKIIVDKDFKAETEYLRNILCKYHHFLDIMDMDGYENAKIENEKMAKAEKTKSQQVTQTDSSQLELNICPEEEEKIESENTEQISDKLNMLTDGKINESEIQTYITNEILKSLFITNRNLKLYNYDHRCAATVAERVKEVLKIMPCALTTTHKTVNSDKPPESKKL